MEIADEKMEIADQKMEIADQTMEIADQNMEIADGNMEIADQSMEIADQKMEIARTAKAVNEAPVAALRALLVILFLLHPLAPAENLRERRVVRLQPPEEACTPPPAFHVRVRHRIACVWRDGKEGR
eukprot:847187-Rhodomonas_salina.1